MERRKLLAAWGLGVFSAVSLIVFVGMALQDAKPVPEKKAREERQAQQEAAERTVAYDPQNYIGFDPQAFFVPPRVSELKVEERHALQDCVLEYAGSVTEATDATIFVNGGDRVGLGPVFGDPGFHAHVIAGGKDKVFRPDTRGNLIIDAGPAPAKIVLVTTPFTIDYPSARVFIPPYTMSLRVMDGGQTTGTLGAQPFARAIKPTEEAAADLFVTTSSRSDSEFVFAAYDLSGKREDLECGLWLTSGEKYILEPTFRAWVEAPTGRVTQKVEILSFPPDVGYSAAGADTFDLETEAGAMARVAIPPRPHIDAPDTTVEPLPNVNVTATFYGFPKAASWRIVTGNGRPKPGKPALKVDHQEKSEELTYQVTPMAADRDPEGKPIPCSAFYSLRVARKWEKEGGRMMASLVTAEWRPRHGDRVPYVPTTKLLHARIVRLGGQGGAPAVSDYNPLMAGILADAAVRSALGLRELLKPSKNKGSGTHVVVNNYINTEGGGGVAGGGGGGRTILNVNQQGGEGDWMGRWAYERYQEKRQQAEANDKGNPYRNADFGGAGRPWNAWNTGKK